MSWLYTKRNCETPAVLHGHFCEQARRRILVTINDTCHDDETFDFLIEEAGTLIYRECGQLFGSRFEAAKVSDNVYINHFFHCPDENVVDFILACFMARSYEGGKETVEEVNRIMREEGIGYEFTPFVQYPNSERKRKLHRTTSVIVKHEGAVHQQVVMPCLSVLGSPLFENANKEMLAAHEHIRRGDFRDALTCCGAANESVMKIICTQKGWTYPKNATCGPLVDVLMANSFAAGVYKDVLTAPGRLRNELSSAHGKGPNPTPNVSIEAIDHMIHITLANILFLVKTARL